MSAEPTTIIRDIITRGRTNVARYRYFSDDVTFTCKHILVIQHIVTENISSDNRDYIYELCGVDICESTLNIHSYDKVLSALNAMKKVFGSKAFNEIVLLAKKE